MMAWSEPLTARVVVVEPWHFRADVLAGDGNRVAALHVTYSDASASARGLRLTDPNGAPRQKVRAVLLLTRAALDFAAGLGIRRVHADAAPRLARLAQRVFGDQGELDTAGNLHVRAELYEARSNAITLDTHPELVADADLNL